MLTASITAGAQVQGLGLGPPAHYLVLHHATPQILFDVGREFLADSVIVAIVLNDNRGVLIPEP